MDTIKINNITMEKHKVKRLEELIGLVDDDAYTPSDSELLIAEIRAITGCTLDDETIHYDYCSHYYSHGSLEEVAYALISNGEYPKIDKYEISFWKRFGKPVFTDDDIYTAYSFRYMENRRKSIMNELEIFLIDELLSEVENQFPDWAMEDRGSESIKYIMDFYTFRPKKRKKYGFEEEVHITIYDNRFVFVTFYNIDESVRNIIVEEMKTLGNTVSEYKRMKRYPKDYKLTDEKAYARRVKEYEINFWKASDKTDLTDKYIYKNFLYRENKKIKYDGVLKSISIDEIYAWINSSKQGSFYDWDVEVSDNRLGQRFVILRPDAEAGEKYDIPPYIIISLYHGEIGTVAFRNIDENIRDGLAEYMKSLKYTVFVKRK